MINIPSVKVGIVAVSRDCFPESLSVNRRKALVKAYEEKYEAADIYECPICIVESEIHMVQALEDVKKAGCDALVVYLGNFGPEISETLLAKHFDGPVMFVAAAGIGALQARKFKGLGPKLMILRLLNPVMARAMGRNSWIMSAMSAFSNESFSHNKCAEATLPFRAVAQRLE